MTPDDVLAVAIQWDAWAVDGTSGIRGTSGTRRTP
jgi:hypothetical protein